MRLLLNIVALALVVHPLRLEPTHLGRPVPPAIAPSMSLLPHCSSGSATRSRSPARLCLGASTLWHAEGAAAPSPGSALVGLSLGLYVPHLPQQQRLTGLRGGGQRFAKKRAVKPSGRPGGGGGRQLVLTAPRKGGGLMSQRRTMGQRALTEYIQKKRAKQQRRNLRKQREEVLGDKTAEKELKKISAMLWSAHLKDEDTEVDRARVAAAIKRYQLAEAAGADPSENFRTLEEELWKPPRVRQVSGLSEDLSTLPWDFPPTPEVYAQRRAYRERMNMTGGRLLFIDNDEQSFPLFGSVEELTKKRPREGTRPLTEEEDDEISAPDIEALTYIEPSIFACPEGDVENPHRAPGPGKALIESTGSTVKAQTTKDVQKPLTFDPLDEWCYQDRETLENQLFHMRRKLTFRWALTDPRCHAHANMHAHMYAHIHQLFHLCRRLTCDWARRESSLPAGRSPTPRCCTHDGVHTAPCTQRTHTRTHARTHASITHTNAKCAYVYTHRNIQSLQVPGIINT